MMEEHETKLVQSIVKKDWVCLDIGANIGYYTTLLAPLCKYVYAFEAEPTNYKTLKQNTEELDNVLVENLIISDKDEWGKLYPCIGDYNGREGMHRIYPSKWCSDKYIQIESVSLDVFFDSCQHIDFIKMDIEGSEYGALRGMTNILFDYKPKMLIEFHPISINEYGINPEVEYNFLKSVGYSITLIPNIEIMDYQQLYDLTNDQSGGKNIFCQ